MRRRLLLKEVLAKKNLSQSKLSHMTFISLNTIQEIVKDPYRDIRLSTLDTIALALEVPITDLYVREEEK